MVLQRIIKNAGNTFNFTDYKVQVSALVTTNVNYFISGYGLSAAGSNYGPTLCDTAYFTPNLSITVVPGTPLVFPFTSAFIPKTHFDAIVLIIIDGVRYPQGFSSSPDNNSAAVQRITPTYKNIYWANLSCFGLNNAGSSYTNNRYMFGGNGMFQSSAPLIINFSELTTASLTVTYKMSLFTYLEGFRGTVTRTATVPSGVISHQITDAGDISPGSTGNIFPTDNRLNAGYFTIELTVNDPAYESLLPFYHWGRA